MTAAFSTVGMILTGLILGVVLGMFLEVRIRGRRK